MIFSQIEPKLIFDTLLDEGWLFAKTAIGIKWVFRNKMDKNGIINRDKSKLVAKKI